MLHLVDPCGGILWRVECLRVGLLLDVYLLHLDWIMSEFNVFELFSIESISYTLVVVRHDA